MSGLIPILPLFAALATPVDETLPRNPFWPHGYEGTRHPITIEPRFKPEPPPSVAETNVANRARQGVGASVVIAEGDAPPDALDDQLWLEAVRELSFGSTLSYTSADHSQSTVCINGLAYGVGDLVSVRCGINRFTWRVEALSSDGKLRLKRLHFSPLRKNP